MELLVQYLRLVKDVELTASVWDDRRIEAGDDFVKQINEAVCRADIAILLVTVNFLNSRFIWQHEVPPLLVREREGKTQIVPLLVDHCPWDLEETLRSRQFRPRPLIPLADPECNPNAVLTRLAREVSLLLQRNRLQAADAGDPKRILRIMNEIDESLVHCWDTTAQPRRIDNALSQVREEALEIAQRRRERVQTRVAGMRLRTSFFSFKDRTEEQDQINRLLSAPDSLVVQVAGRGGMGKTALACQVLRRLEDNGWPRECDGPEISGIVYLSTRTGGITLDRIYSELMTLLPLAKRSRVDQIWCQPAANVDDKIVRLLEATTGGFYILLFDNLEDLLDDENRLRDPYLQRLIEIATTLMHGLRFLVTTRQPVSFGPASGAVRTITLSRGLPIVEAKDLLFEMLSEENEAGTWPQATVEALAKRFFGVPRALEIVAGALLNDPLMRPDQFLLHSGKRSAAAAEAIIRDLAEQTYGRLDSDAMLVMQALAIFGRPVKPVALDFLLRPHVPGIDVPRVVRRLCRTHLAPADRQSQSVSVHPIDRELLYQMLPDTGPRSRQELHRTAAQYYVQEQVVGALEWEDFCELDPFLHEFEHLVQARDFDDAAQRLGKIANRMTWRGLAEKVRILLAQVSGKLSMTEAKLTFYMAACANMTVLGPLSLAVLNGRRALRLATALARPSDEAHAHWRTALAYRYRLGSAAKAERHFSLALAANERAGTPERNPWIMCELSLVASYMRRAKHAREIAIQASAILESPIGQKLGPVKSTEVRAHVWQALGYAHCIGRDRIDAIHASQRAIDTWNERFPPGQICGYALHTIALAHAMHADYDQARPVWERARDLAQAQGQPRLDGICAFNLAMLHFLRGEQSEALELCRFADVALHQVQMEAAPRALAGWIRNSSTDDLAACAKLSWDCPDLYGYDLFGLWLSTTSIEAK
jgi:tetratricopeptide (TPR) repeat protein